MSDINEEKWNRWFSQQIKFGFLKDTLDDRDFFGGTLPKEVLQPDGQWKTPIFERQKRGIETYACVSFGTLNIVEMLGIVKFGEEWNKSDRFLAKMSDTMISGNSPRKVYDALRHKGIVDENVWPYPNTTKWNEYYKDIPQCIQRKAKKWEYEFGYEKIHKADIKEYLQYSPIGCSVSAWHEKENIYYKPEGSEDNHFCVIVGYTDFYWKVFDTYKEEIKLLDNEYDFGYLARYTLERKPKRTLLNIIIEYLKDIFT